MSCEHRPLSFNYGIKKNFQEGGTLEFSETVKSLVSDKIAFKNGPAPSDPLLMTVIPFFVNSFSMGVATYKFFELSSFLDDDETSVISAVSVSTVTLSTMFPAWLSSSTMAKSRSSEC